MIEKCKPDFKDTEENTCKRYLAEKYCTPNGGYGEGWQLENFGPFIDFQVDGYDARNCPECGCIGTKTNN